LWDREDDAGAGRVDENIAAKLNLTLLSFFESSKYRLVIRMPLLLKLTLNGRESQREIF
jgi:hypothetical protein